MEIKCWIRSVAFKIRVYDAAKISYVSLSHDTYISHFFLHVLFSLTASQDPMFMITQVRILSEFSSSLHFFLFFADCLLFLLYFSHHDQDGIIKMVNSAATTVFQYEKSEFLEQNISMITGEHAKNHDKYIQNYLKSGVKKAMGQKRELKATYVNSLLAVDLLSIRLEQFVCEVSIIHSYSLFSKLHFRVAFQNTIAGRKTETSSTLNLV